MNYQANHIEFGVDAHQIGVLVFGLGFLLSTPLHYCTVCQQHVALGQSQFECAREHGCSPHQPATVS